MNTSSTTRTAPVARPSRDEAADYYYKYIDQVGDGDIVEILVRQEGELLALLKPVSEDASLYRYGEDKWSIREVLGHINDTERLFSFRALCFGRGLDAPLPSFDQDIAAAAMAADSRSLSSHIDEFRSLRAATVALFRYLPEEAWLRRGEASGYEVTVRALAYILAGHLEHHSRILKERYLPQVG